jgi:cobalt-zinc-cadmium efflux system protein
MMELTPKHEHEHEHEHHQHPHAHHHHSPALKSVSRVFWAGILLNSAFVLIEFVTGILTNSLALLSDAGHNLSDVAGLGLSLFAFKISKAKATEKFTYGYHKSTILAALINAVVLLIVVGSIGWEAIHRFLHPQATNGTVIAFVAGIGIVINALSALLFFREKEKDLNVRGAYLHLALDAIVSIGVVLAGLLIRYTGLLWIDPLISLIIMAVVVYSTWGLLRESVYLSMDAVPGNVDVERIKKVVLKWAEVKNIHHIHVWAMSTTRNAMTAHITLDKQISEKQLVELKNKIKMELAHLNIQHVTLETESQSCVEAECHA